MSGARKMGHSREVYWQGNDSRERRIAKHREPCRNSLMLATLITLSSSIACTYKVDLLTKQPESMSQVSDGDPDLMDASGDGDGDVYLPTPDDAGSFDSGLGGLSFPNG